MNPYITVYKSDETDFSHNGLRILLPTSCKITETLNGEYSLTLSHPLDEQGSWRFLIEYNIIKCQGQLFRIFRKKTSMNSNGHFERTVEALHIFYDLNFYFIMDTRPIYKNGPDALEWLMNNTYTRRMLGSTPNHQQQPSAQFTFSSDLYSDDIAENIQYRHTAYYQKMSVTKALIGADNSFVNVWGGEIKRDNFHFTINKQRGISNAFSIRYGVDMLEIQETVDFSSYCEAVYWEGTFKYGDNEMKYQGIASLSRLNMPTLPVMPMKSISLNLTENDIRSGWTNSDVTAAFDKAAKDYMLTNCSPSVNYRVTFANLKNIDKYKDFIGLQRCELGDIGTIYNEELGINTTQQIVKKTVDGITGDIVSVDLGSLRRTFTSDGRINGGYDSIRTELIKNELSYENTWEALGEQGYALDDLNLSWNSLAGEVSSDSEEVT